MKTSDQNDLKLGTVVVLNFLPKPNYLGFKRSMVRGIISHYWHPIHISGMDAATQFKFGVWLLPADRKLCWNTAGVAEYKSL